MRELHVGRFEMGRALTMVRLHVRTTRGMLRVVALLHTLWALQMRRQLVLVRHRTVCHAVVGC